MDLRAYKTILERRKALEEELGVELPHIGTYSLQEEIASTRNCENMIGVAQVPIGVAGPLRFKIQDSRFKDYYIPLATTEGALVASVSRGCKAIAISGGATVLSQKIGITRAPVFSVSGIIEGKKLRQWVEENFSQLKEITESTSSHLTLIGIQSWMIGMHVFLRFQFDTQDAMGMNMATIATAKAATYIEEKTNAKLLSLSSNMCVDKKPSALNFILGRGISVWAEVILSKEALQEVFKTTAEKFVASAQAKLVEGSTMSASLGANAHMANVLSAIFLATGQDIAHVTESSMGVTTVHLGGKNEVYVSIYLPDLVIGTVGGGTGLATQHEALQIMGIAGGNNGKNSIQLAEIIGAAVLAGEISLLASLAEHTLACSHERLARGKK